MGHSHSHSGARDPAEHAPALRRVTLAAILVSLFLVLIKTGGWSYTNASSLLSSLADSLFDVLVSSINFFAVRYAAVPADEEHRHGHTGIEDIAGLAQFAFICGSMLFVMAHAARQFFLPDEMVTDPQYGIGVMLVSLIVTSALVLYQRRVSTQTGSLIVKADSLHYLSDVFTNLSIIGSLLAVKYLGVQWLDPLLAVAIALYVIREAWEIGARSFNNLMNREMPDSEKEKILQIVRAAGDVKEFHHLKTRYAGAKPFIQMHVGLDRNLSFQEAHDIADALEKKLETAFPGADVILHQDPV